MSQRLRKIKNLPHGRKNSIYLIVPDENGTIHCNQTGGHCCNQRTIKGRAYRLCKNERKIGVFNPSWWCDLYRFHEGALQSVSYNRLRVRVYINGKRRTFSDKSWQLFEITKEGRELSYDKKVQFYKKMHNAALKHPMFITWQVLKNAMEYSIEAIMPKEFESCEVIGTFDSRVTNEFINEEAWVKVRLYKRNSDKDIEGILTWENCD